MSRTYLGRISRDRRCFPSGLGPSAGAGLSQLTAATQGKMQDVGYYEESVTSAVNLLRTTRVRQLGYSSFHAPLHVQVIR